MIPLDSVGKMAFERALQLDWWCVPRSGSLVISLESVVGMAFD